MMAYFLLREMFGHHVEGAVCAIDARLFSLSDSRYCSIDFINNGIGYFNKNTGNFPFIFEYQSITLVKTKKYGYIKRYFKFQW